MKKIYKFLFLLLFGLFIFIPKDTFAQELSLQPNRIDFYDTSGNTLAYTMGFTSQNYSNLLFYGVYYENYTASNLYTFSSLDPSLTSDKHYDFNFYILQPNINQGFAGASFSNNNTPIVSVGHSMCEVSSTSTIIDTGTDIAASWSSIFSVRCPNVHLSQSAFTVNVMTPFAPGDSINSPFFYAISSMFNISESFNYSSGDLNSAIKENTEEIKEQTDAIKEQTEATEKQTEAITSEEAPKLDALEDSAGWLPPGPVDSILNLPLTFFNNLVSNLSKTCQPVNVPLPYVNKNLTLPCISILYNQLGATTFLNWVGVIVGTIILYNYFLNLYKWIDDTIQMKDNSVDDWGGV